MVDAPEIDLFLIDNSRSTAINYSTPEYLTREDRGTQPQKPNWRLLRRSFLGLTQTCHQLRKEFLPLHQRYTPIKVAFDKLPDYARTCIENTYAANVMVEPRDSGTIDIPDVVLLFSKASTINIRSRDLVLNQLLVKLQKNPHLLEYIENKAIRVIITVNFRIVLDPVYGDVLSCLLFDGMDLYLNEEFAEEWMEESWKAKNEENLQRWRRELGVDGFNVLPVLGNFKDTLNLEKAE